MMNEKSTEFKICIIPERISSSNKLLHFRLYDTIDGKVLFERDFTYSESDNISDPCLHFFNIVKNEVHKITGDDFLKGYMKEAFNLDYYSNSKCEEKKYDIFHDVSNFVAVNNEISKNRERLFRINKSKGKYELFLSFIEYYCDYASFEVTIDEVKSIIKSLSEFVKNEDIENWKKM